MVVHLWGSKWVQVLNQVEVEGLYFHPRICAQPGAGESKGYMK